MRAGWLGLMGMALLCACGGCTQPGSTAASPSSPSSPSTAAPRDPAQVDAGSWTIEPGVRVPNASAPSTVRLADGSYRMYLPGLEVRSSTDGLNWSAPQRIALAEPGEFLRNPAVIRLEDRSWVMIYEGVRDERGPNRRTAFYRATSKDGLRFEKIPGSGANGAVMEPLAADGGFMSAPDIISVPGAGLRLYFNTADGARVEVARSSDAGLSWTREGAITIDGFERGRKAADPDIVALPGGAGYRVFFAAGAIGAPKPRIFSASSKDGLQFTLDPGERLMPPDVTLEREDPELVEIAPGVYRMYFAEGASPQGPFSLRSAVLAAP